MGGAISLAPFWGKDVPISPGKVIQQWLGRRTLLWRTLDKEHLSSSSSCVDLEPRPMKTTVLTELCLSSKWYPYKQWKVTQSCITGSGGLLQVLFSPQGQLWMLHPCGGDATQLPVFTALSLPSGDICAHWMTVTREVTPRVWITPLDLAMQRFLIWFTVNISPNGLVSNAEAVIWGDNLWIYPENTY